MSDRILMDPAYMTAGTKDLFPFLLRNIPSAPPAHPDSGVSACNWNEISRSLTENSHPKTCFSKINFSNAVHEILHLLTLCAACLHDKKKLRFSGNAGMREALTLVTPVLIPRIMMFRKGVHNALYVPLCYRSIATNAKPR